MAGRVFFSIIALSVLAMIIWLLSPRQAPRNWVATFAAEPLDELTLAIPFAKDDSQSWIPESATPRHHVIKDLSSDDQLVQEIEAIKKQSHPPTAKDHLIVYFVGYGINDDPAIGPQIVVKARSNSEAIENGGKDTKTAEISHHRVPLKTLLKALIDLPFNSILLVVDCSRTLDCPRWGWEQTGTFAKGLESVVTNFNGSSDRELKKAEKLWVISASDSRQLGLSLQKKKHSLFGQAWHQSLAETSKESKKWSKPIDLKELFGKLRANTGGGTNEKSAPFLFHGGHGLVDRSYAAGHNQIVWFGEVAKFDSPAAQEATPEEIEKRKELISLLKTTKPEEMTAVLAGVMESVGFSPELRSFLGLWKQIEEVESGIGVTGVPNLDPDLSNPGVDQSLSPLIYAPHLWRRLKWQLVADECAVLADQAPKFSLESYKNELLKLKSWPRFEPAVSSITVFDQLNIAWHHYSKYKSEHAIRANNAKKEQELIAAHRQYAETLYALSELTALENRLASVTNARPFSRSDNVDLDKAASLIISFYRTGVEVREASLEQQIDDVIAIGKSLQEWKAKALGEWYEFARTASDELKDGTNPRSNWNTLELLLTSSLWSTEQRLQWRIAQSFFKENAASVEGRPGESGKPPNHSSMIELIKKIGDGIEPFPTQSSGLPKWYRDFAIAANQTAIQDGRNSARAYLLAALSDPRDSRLFSEPYAIWLESKLHPRAEPESFSLELVSTEIKTPDSKTPEVKAEAVKPPPEPINLDSTPGRKGEFKFMVCWKPSRDRKSGDFPKVKLNASFDDKWITADREMDVVFDGNEQVKDDGTRQKAISWPVAMLKDKTRVKPDEPSSVLLKIDFDESDFKKQNQSRETAPRLQVQRDKASLQLPITLRNRRSVSLSLKQGNWNHTRRSPSELAIFEAPLLAGRDTSFEWRVKNESPIGVSVTAQLWKFNRSDDWTSPWGRIPSDNVANERKNGTVSLKDKSLLAEYKFASIGVAEDQVISWAAPATGAKDQQQVDVTHGLYCRLSVDTDEQATRDYWIELVPRAPRKWLAANATLTPDSGPSIFDVSITRRDNNWPWQAYQTLNFSKLKATLTLPPGWKDVNGISTEIPGATRSTGQISAEFQPKTGANDQLTFLDVDGWHRAFRWQVKVYPGEKGDQNISETYRLNFTRLTFTNEYDKPPAAIVEGAKEPALKKYEMALENWKNGPLLIQFPSPKKLPTSKLYVSFEADALENVFSPDGDCSELRIEQLFGELARPKTLFARRADRNWTTTSVLDPQNPDKLVFRANVSDFDEIELENVELSERLVTLRAAFYAPGAQSPSQADGKNEVQVLFDGTKPSIELQGVRLDQSLDQKGIDLVAGLKVNDDRADKPGSGVKVVRSWLRPASSSLRPLTPAELAMPGKSDELKKDQTFLEVRIPINEVAPANRQFLYILATDRVGLDGELEKEITQLSVPAVKPGGGMKDGVILGKLRFPTGKEADGFTVRLNELEDPDAEKRTNANGEFRFEKLDRGVEYTLTVRSRLVGTTNYGLSQPKKLKPRLQSGVKEEQIDLIDMSPTKK